MVRMTCPLHIVPGVTITQEGNIPVQSTEENLCQRQMLHLCNPSRYKPACNLTSLAAVTAEQ